jgi:membrane protein
MAALRDVLPAVRAVGPIPLFRDIWVRSNANDLFTLAAAMAYSWLFAIFPFLLFLLTLAPYLPRQQKDYARMQISNSIRRVLPHEGAATLLDGLNAVLDQPRTGLLSVGLVVTLWAASGGVAMTMYAMDRVYEAPRPRPFYTQRPVAIVLTVVLTVLLLLVLLLMPVASAVLHYLAAARFVPHRLLEGLNLARHGLAMLLMFCVLALLYRFGTVVRTKLILFSPGAIFTVAVWLLLAAAFSFYVNRFGSYQKTYGTLGGVAILLLFFYVDALVLMLGAEINASVDRALGDGRNSPSGAAPIHTSAVEGPSTSATTGAIES